uniref:Uncharacterized protein n=1 Tax=Arundo donax TaxID=35708 RepID=A0A0A9EGE0_ARUDO
MKMLVCTSFPPVVSYAMFLQLPTIPYKTSHCSRI